MKNHFNDRMIAYYMDVAKRTAELSYAKKLKVGSIIVKEDRIISIGYNGTASGHSNVCEYVDDNGNLKTYDEVIHAEMNALGKLAKCPESGKGSSIFITHSPCIQCAKGIYSAEIEQLFYLYDYRSSSGLEFLSKCGIAIKKVVL